MAGAKVQPFCGIPGDTNVYRTDVQGWVEFRGYLAGVIMANVQADGYSSATNVPLQFTNRVTTVLLDKLSAVHDAKYYDSFVFVGAVHNLPTPGDPFSNTWEHVHNIFTKSGIQDDMVSSHGVASISVQPDQARQAAELIRRDATSNGYWVDFDKAFR